MIAKPKAICWAAGDARVPVRIYVTLGSNMGSREDNVREASERLSGLAIGPVQRSSLYLTDPQDMEDDSEGFVNAAATFMTGLSPDELLAATQQIEVNMGRPADHPRNVARIIDIDIICFGDRRIENPGLTLPHPRAHERLFVLLPLAELAPDLLLPGHTASVRELIAALVNV